MAGWPQAFEIARRFAIAGMAATVCGCGGGGREPEVDVNLYPADYKAEIIKAMGSILNDTANIRDAGVSEPALMPLGGAPRYAACVRFNPLKSRKEYAGLQVRLAIFHGGQLSQFLAATPEQCAQAAYKPFPELEKICMREKC